MINDFQTDAGFEEVHCDICIVGSGALGFALALEFIGSPYKVVVLEGGGASAEEETQKLYQTINRGLQHNNYTGRIRVFGGTTTRWAGQASPFDKIDFESRDWVPHSGWPIDRETIEPYFTRVETIMGVEHRAYNKEDWPVSKDDLPSLDQNFRLVYSQFSPHANFAAAYRSQLEQAENIQVLLHANVTHLQLAVSGKELNSIQYKSLSGRQGKVFAKHSILCCGGIETARLMLASKDVAKKGVGNENDLVGRFFHDHIHMHVAELQVLNKKSLKALQTFYKKGLRYCPKVAITSEIQRKERILNIAGDVYYKNNPLSPLQTLKDLVKYSQRDNFLRFPGGFFSALFRIFKGLPQILKVVCKYIFFNQVMVDDSGPLYLGVQCEQAPNPESRIYLSDEKDALGLPKVVVQWELTDLDKKTIEMFIKKVDEDFKKLGVAELKLETLPRTSGSLFPYEVLDSNHHMGTTRMASDPEQGVVDENCRVYGLENLYIAGTGVLPTGGFSNPTFNALALGLRLTDNLKEQLSNQKLKDRAL